MGRVTMLVEDWLDEVLTRLEDAIYITEDPDRAERLLRIEQRRDAEEVLQGTKDVGEIHALIQSLTRDREKVQLDLEEAEYRVKELLAEGRDESDPEMATMVRVVAVLGDSAASLEGHTRQAMREKEITRVYVQSLELARQQAEAQDKATLAMQRANRVGELMLGHMQRVAGLGSEQRSSIRARLREATVRHHDSLVGQREAVQMILQMRGEATIAEQTRLNRKEQVVFARLQREVAAEAEEAGVKETTADAS